MYFVYQTVIFDLDGTLLNSLKDLAAAGNYVCQQNGWPTHSLEEYRYFVGNGIPKLCERFSPPSHRTTEQLQQTLSQFQTYYALHKQDFTAPYPGILQLLQNCIQNNIGIGVVTNKAHPFAQDIVNHYFSTMIPFVQGATSDIPAKPNPIGVLALMQKMHANPASTLFVGDSNVDIFTASNAQIDSCGVLWGFRTKQELIEAGATHIAQNPDALWNIISH